MLGTATGLPWPWPACPFCAGACTELQRVAAATPVWRSPAAQPGCLLCHGRDADDQPRACCSIAGCGSAVPNTKWSASQGISGKAPILGYNPSGFGACCARCAETTSCASFTFLARPASVGNLCYLYFAGATSIATLPSTFSTFYSGKRECNAHDKLGGCSAPTGCLPLSSLLPK